MKVIFKHYKKENFKDLKKCMEELADFLVKIDPLRRLRRLPAYGQIYTKSLLKKISEQKGLIILTYDQEKIIGCIAGVIEKQSQENLLECIPTKTGRVLELFVSKSYRSKGLGKQLIQKMEIYFKKNKCNNIKIEVFAPNKNAYKFYQRLNYSDRVVDMIKLLSKNPAETFKNKEKSSVAKEM